MTANSSRQFPLLPCELVETVTEVNGNHRKSFDRSLEKYDGGICAVPDERASNNADSSSR